MVSPPNCQLFSLILWTNFHFLKFVFISLLESSFCFINLKLVKQNLPSVSNDKFVPYTYIILFCVMAS